MNRSQTFVPLSACTKLSTSGLFFYLVCHLSDEVKTVWQVSRQPREAAVESVAIASEKVFLFWFQPMCYLVN